MELELIKFLNKLQLTPANNGHRFVLVEPFMISLDKTYFEIPTGFWTDFASIPKALQNILSPLDSHLRAAVLHDYLYYKQAILNAPITREYADKCFLRAMKTCGTNYCKRYTIYYAVRSFGWITWNKYKDDRIKNKEIK